jgi:hypothetical protein
MAKVLKRLKSIDIGESPELVRIVDEVTAGGEPVVLRLDGRDLAILEPLTEGTIHRTRRELTPEEIAAFEASAGAWKDLPDVDEMVRYIKSLRGLSEEPTDA